MNAPRVSIIVVNWNRSDDVLACLRHLERRRGDGPAFEVLVVDNGSSDGSGERLQGEGGIRLIRLDRNLGPAAARNLAIARARGEYLLFLDSDAMLGRGDLARMVGRMDRDPEVGILGCRIVNGYTRKLDQWIYAEPAATHERREFATYSFSAAGALVRASALREAGPFWGDLFIYNEEVDLSIRVLRAGYKVLYFPSAKVFHFASPRGRGGPETYWYYQSRNWIWIFYRYYPRAARWKKVATYSAAYAVKGLLNGRLRASLAGLAAGLRRTDLIARFGDKLSRDELRALEALNRGRSLKVGRG